MSNNNNTDNVVEIARQEAICNCVPIASKGLPLSIKQVIDNTMSDGTSFVVLPLFEIDGLKVRCEFVVNENGMSLWIITYKMLMYNIAQHDERAYVVHQMLFRKTYIKKLTKYSLKDYESVIKHMNNDIKVMKFDKLNGVFTTPQIAHPRELPHVCSNKEILNSVPCDEEHPEECSVCLDTTKTTTPCGHKLCVSCWCLIKINGRELPCPICRADLLQSKKIGIINSRIDEDIADNENVDDDDDDDDDDDTFASMYDDSIYEALAWQDLAELAPPEFPSVRQNTIMDMY
jgi:hypothetical protein